MKKNAQIVGNANKIYDIVVDDLNLIIKSKESVVKKLLTAKPKEKEELFNNVLGGVESVVKAVRVDGVGLPKFLTNVTCTEDFSAINLTIRSKLKSAIKYKKSFEISVDKDITENLGKAYIDALFELYNLEMAQENVDELNAKLAEVVAENGIPYGVSFAIKPELNTTIVEITNDHVVFNANVACAHEIANLGIFMTGDSYFQIINQEATEALVEGLKAAQTPVQLIKSKLEVITSVTGVKTKKLASKLIRGAYHRQAKNLDSVKAGVGYFNETVKIGKEEVNVFALVEKTEDGELKVVLNPFDTKTLFNVDFDVLAAIK